MFIWEESPHLSALSQTLLKQARPMKAEIQRKGANRLSPHLLPTPMEGADEEVGDFEPFPIIPKEPLDGERPTP